MTALSLSTVLVVSGLAQGAASGDYAIRPVPFTAVHLDDVFWAPRMETNRAVTVRYCFDKCEETARIDNFAVAAGMMEGEFKGIRFNDSDVFKVIEGAAYSLALKSDPELDRYLDELIEKIARAQEDDGYLYTIRTIKGDDSGDEGRWTKLAMSHELYNIGHMYEAAVAHYLATGKRTLLDVAIKSADLVDRVFGPDKLHDVPGHEEIEIGLVRLYRVTQDERYLRLAKFFIDERGNTAHREVYGAYCQDHIPVTEQAEAVGHAVRAGYLYSGMADVAALTGDRAYIDAIGRIWEDVVSHKLYLTGGIGSMRKGEAFGEPYVLPNKEAYNETCAAIANAMWNHRMFLLHGDARYVDVLERIIYNGFLSGVSFSGDRFFYPNPLECDGAYAFNHGSLERQPWFNCSCCPVNVVRFVPSLAGYVYAQQDDAVYVNLYAAGQSDLEVAGTAVSLTQQTRYPWDGAVEIAVAPEKPAKFTLLLRIPGWAKGAPVPSDLYRYLDPAAGAVTIKVNGKSAKYKEEDGYAHIRRHWRPGDSVEMHLPMPIRRVLSHERVEADAGRVAIERGPIVYCLEAVDNGGSVRNLALPDDAALAAERRDNLLEGVTVITGTALARERQQDGSVEVKPVPFTAVPYYAWDHRGPNEMTVWIPRTPELAALKPVPTIASRSALSASHTCPSDSLRALNDQMDPAESSDQSIPRFTWWDHRGRAEWVEYRFAEPAEVSRVEVYWFDDTGVGACRVPESWRLCYLDGDAWKEVPGPSGYATEKDRFNVVTFDPVRTAGLRIEVQLQPEFSGGLLEWRVGTE
ncbi:MAG: glycoside hydrolase family 127 protein [Candidatus Hydrogenedentes bacterium]|nr:glycoside hydrolase family 127 protein [Candidatus Hydrogenedentota bacterium]